VILGCRTMKTSVFRIRDCHPLWCTYSRVLLLYRCFLTSRLQCAGSMSGPTTPSRQRTHTITPERFRLFPFRSPLLRESLRFLFLELLRWFSSLGCPLTGIFRNSELFRLNIRQRRMGSPIRKSPAQRMFAPPRGLSQLTTSFIDC